MQVVEELGLLATTHIIYTSDHGELFGAHGLLGKSSLYEASVGVPPALGFSMRAMIDQQSFSFSQFWQATGRSRT
jgi:hypothetical protein